MSNPFSDLDAVKAYLFAGKATLTLESARSGIHFTYRVKAHPEKADFFFVSLLTQGSADEGNFAYLGVVTNGQFRITQKSAANADAPSAKAFKFLVESKALHPQLTVRHENLCGVCGRTLTTPESIDRGIGPECLAKRNGA